MDAAPNRLRSPGGAALIEALFPCPALAELRAARRLEVGPRFRVRLKGEGGPEPAPRSDQTKR